MKWLTRACAACLCLCLGTVWWQLRRDADVEVPRRDDARAVAATADGAAAAGNPGRALALADARRSCDPARLDRFIAEQRDRVDAEGNGDDLRLLAEALIERVLLRGQLRGMAIGEPIYGDLPAVIAADVDEALDRLHRARELGDDSAANHRLEAAALGQRITGLGTALQWNGRIEEALAAASTRDDRDPALHVALGLRKLLAPPLLGHDPERALEHLAYAAEAMAADERPCVFAAMASFLCRKRVEAIAWLERAVTRNPNNTFARVVLQRLRRGEEQPFGRDVTAAEATASAVPTSGR